MKKFLINHGIVKTEQQANYVLIAIIILCFIFIFYKLSGNTSPRTINTLDESREFMDDTSLDGDLDAELDAQLQ